GEERGRRVDRDGAVDPVVAPIEAQTKGLQEAIPRRGLVPTGSAGQVHVPARPDVVDEDVGVYARTGQEHGVVLLERLQRQRTLHAGPRPRVTGTLDRVLQALAG